MNQWFMRSECYDFWLQNRSLTSYFSKKEPDQTSSYSLIHKHLRKPTHSKGTSKKSWIETSTQYSMPTTESGF